MKLVLALAVGASAFGGFGKKSAAPATRLGAQVARGGQTPTNIQVPRIFTTAFGDPGRLQERAGVGMSLCAKQWRRRDRSREGMICARGLTALRPPPS